MIQVSLIDSLHVGISWDEPGTGYVFRSLYPTEGFTLIGSSDIGYFEDEPPQQPGPLLRWYYRVLIDSQEIGTAPVTDSSEPSTLYMALMARRQIERIGEDAFLVVGRSQGTRCSECWDSVTGRRMRSDCSTCDGSGYLAGNSQAIPIKMSFSKEEPLPQRTQTAKIMTLQMSAWTSNFPLIKAGDLIVRTYDRRVFEVLQWQPTRRRSFVIRQNITLRMAERGSVADKLVLPQ
jgi:hypothetical protein